MNVYKVATKFRAITCGSHKLLFYAGLEFITIYRSVCMQALTARLTDRRLIQRLVRGKNSE